MYTCYIYIYIHMYKCIYIYIYTHRYAYTQYMHVYYRKVNFGPSPMAPLPFACRMLADASQAQRNIH